EVARRRRSVGPPVRDVRDVEEVREPAERERGELRATREAEQRHDAERADEDQRRARDQTEHLIEEEAEPADLRREREDLLLVADEVVARVRDEDPEHAPVDVAEQKDEHCEWTCAGDDATED